MGKPIPNPIVPGPVSAGTLCTVCWGLGKPLGPGGTPSEIIVSVSGVNKNAGWSAGDGEPIEGNYIVPQAGGGGCSFEVAVGFGRIGVLFFTSYTDVTIENDQGRLVFIGRTDSACELEMPNTQTVDFEGGSVLITIPPLL